jgi:hypothetical protein
MPDGISPRAMPLSGLRGALLVLAGDPDPGEEGIGEGGSHALRVRGFADGTDWPVRRDPFPAGVRQQRGQPDLAAFLVDRRGLDDGDFVAAEAPNDIEATGQGRVAEGPTALPGYRRRDRDNEGFFRVGEFALGLG